MVALTVKARWQESCLPAGTPGAATAALPRVLFSLEIDPGTLQTACPITSGLGKRLRFFRCGYL